MLLFKIKVPTAQGTVNGKKVIAFREIGCTGCVVHTSFVSSDQLLGKESDVTLIDESTQRYPLAMVEIDCPFSQEKLRHYVWMIHYMTLLLEILMGQNFWICPIFQLRQLLGHKLIRKRLIRNLLSLVRSLARMRRHLNRLTLVTSNKMA